MKINNLLLLQSLFVNFFIISCAGQKNDPHYRSRKKINSTQIQMMKAQCGPNGCKGQTEKAKSQRATIQRHIRSNPQSNEKSDESIDRQLNKMYLAKKALLQEQGLHDIEPLDNGMYGGDMLLSEEQSDRIIKRAQGIRDTNDQAPSKESGSSDGDEPPPSQDDSWRNDAYWNRFKGKGPGGWKGSGKGGGPWKGGPGKGGGSRGRNSRSAQDGRERRAAALSLDTFTGNKWPTNTLNYYINPSTFTPKQIDMIRGVLKDIQSRTCIKFNEAKKNPYIEYLKADASTDAGTCGWAYMGYQGNYNPVHINFRSSVCSETLQGVIAHETLHTLGLSHEHTRYDRDKYITINWKNVDPQSIDVFDKDDPYDVNPYCIPYDYESVMHYDCFVGAKSSDLPTAVPKTNPDYYISKIGNALKPSKNDIDLINKLYCTPDSCKDTNPYCGFSCSQCQAKFLKACPKSCDQCKVSL